MVLSQMICAKKLPWPLLHVRTYVTTDPSSPPKDPPLASAERDGNSAAGQCVTQEKHMTIGFGLWSLVSGLWALVFGPKVSKQIKRGNIHVEYTCR